MLGGRCFLSPGNTVSAQAGRRAVSPCPAMGPNLLLLLFLGLAGQGLATSLPEALQAPVGGAILVQCHYRLQDIRAPKVEMIGLREEDSGEYGCVVKGSAGPLTVHRVALAVFPPASGLKEEEEEEEKEKTHKVGSLADSPFVDPMGSASPLEPSWDEKSIPLIWGTVVLLGLLVVAVVLFAVMVKRRGNRPGVCSPLQSSGVSGMVPSAVAHHVRDSEVAADFPSDIQYVRLDSPPSFDNTTYTGLPLDPPSGNPPPPPPSSSPPLPPKVLCSRPVTDTFPGGDKGGGASCEPAQDSSDSQTPPS
ncbi:trem-like transcript 1 protein isoform X2 [Manis pentadactyla]|uniref:trem-like transcript 1 protein isoform X2 n=1 Tax=Manis pentadactyla TaxID=143292 RepID=UPI00255CAF3D|nr:trem-like transcript 1 protein isoform X2 [Manis pentadactyla]KAI5278982.1 Trem-Like Transcript 1 Protein [Manis pentadactyla]